MSDFVRAQDEQRFLLQQQQMAEEREAVLSSGKLCKYFFTQMSVTILFLVIFEAETNIPEFLIIEKFLIYQCILLVIDLLFFLFRSGK